MTDASKSIAKKIQLLAKKSNGSRDQQNYEITAGAGDAGAPLRVKAQSATRYELLDPKTERAPQHVRAKRSGRDLEIFLEGSEAADIVIEQYYDEGIVEFPKDSLTGVTGKGDVSIYVIDEGLRPAMSTLEAHVTPITLLENAAWFNPWWGIAGIAALHELQSDSGVAAPAAPTAKLAASSDTGVSNSDRLTSDNTPTLEGTGTAGDTITVKDAQGNVIATAVVAANGTWSATPTAALVDGVYDFSITESSPAGQTSPETHLQVTIAGDLTITGSVTAGPVSAGVTLTAYDNTGALLGTATIQSDGTFSILSPNKGAYRGAVLLKAVDSNASGTNYLDEVTAANKSLGSSLRAMGVAEAGQAQFTIQANDATLVIHITPVTELAVMKAGITTDSAPASASFVLQVNQAIANVLGLNGVDITAQPVATNSAGFDASNGLSTSEKYGLLLTKLSGLDSLNGGSLAVSLMQLAQNINTSGNGTLTAEGAALVDQGRQQALAALKNAPSSAEKTFATDTVLNRQLLGDVIVQSQTLNANGLLEVSGIALPGSTVQVTFPDGTTQSAVANSAGQFTLASAAVQATLEIPLKVTGADGLSQPAALVAPAAPVVETGNGKIVSGTGTPGSTVTVKDALGQIVGSAVVDALGQWSFVPTTPLADNAVLRASAVDSSGNVSGPAAGTVDVDRVSVRLAEAADGYINAAEKASGGISFDIGLPAMAQVGDTISTVVTLPNGNTLTLVDVLTAAQVAAGAITRTLTPAQLATDGLYNAAISLVTQVGQSAPVHQSFIVDATAPAAPVVSPSNGQIINGTAEVGTTVTVTDGAGHVIGTVGPVGPDGNWTLLPAQPLPNGTALSATATDVAGNTSGPGANSVDTDALLITGAIDSVGPQLGLLADGSATNDTSPQFAGSLGTGLQPGQTLVVYRQLANGTAVKVGTADVNGTAWTFQDGAGTGLNAPLADGNYTWQVVVETAAGPVAGLTPSGYFDLTVNTVRPAAPATVVPEAAGSDTFVSAAEKATDGGVPIVTQLAAGARVGDVLTTTVTLPDGSTRVLNTTLTVADIQAGHVSQLLTQSALVTDGAYSASTTITSAINGLVSAPTTNHFTLDTSAPAAGTGALATASDTGTLGDNTTNDNTPALSGVAEANASVQIVVNGQTYTATANAQGVWSLPATATLPDGTYTPVITVTDAAGNSSTANGTPFAVDTSAPAAGTGALATASDTGTLGDNTTNDNTPALSGTAEANASVQIVVNGQTYTATANAQGVWSLPATATLPDGSYTPVITVTDAAGNSSTANGTPFTVDASAPSAPAVALPEAANGINAAEAASLGGTPIVTTLPADAKVGDTVTTVVTNPNGTTSTLTHVIVAAELPAVQGGTATGAGPFTISQLIPSSALTVDGAWTTRTTLTDTAGNTSAATAGAFTLDTLAPAAGTGALATASDTGTLGDNTTNDNTPTLSGTAEAGASVQIVVGGQTYTVTANAQGVWTLPATATLPDGSYTPVITVTDAAGNSSAAVNGTPFTVDASAPATPGVTIPDASHGVNATEASDGVALVVSLPNDAVAGDTLTTVVTKPDGTTLTLTRVLTAADITAGQYSQTVPQTELLTSGSTTQYRDGAWTTSTTLTDTAGNTSQPQTDGFALSANGPALTLGTVAGDGTVNALEKTGDLPLSGTTTAEAGQPVTVQLLDASNNVIGTFYTVVQPNGTFALNIPQAQLPADGAYTLTANVSNFAGTPAAQQTRPVLFDTTAPTISVTSVAGDAVNATSSGTFDGTERGFNLSDYTLSNTVTTPPVLSGTTTAEVGQTVNVLFNQVSYTATVQAGTTGNPNTWSVELTETEAKALVHGTTYAITASVSDVAGNPSLPDIDNHLVVNIAPPDVPTVNLQYTGTTTPVITGTAQKLSSGSPIALAAGDTLAITLNGVTVTATIQASGTATDITGVTYDPATKIWSLDTAAVVAADPAVNFALADDHTYDVQVSTTTAGGTLTRSDISAGELVIDTTPPTITLNPISPDGAGASVINGAEQNQPVTLTGTTTAQVGSTVTLTWLDSASATLFTATATVQAGTAGGANTFSIPVTGAAIGALTDGTYTPQVSVTNLFGLSGTDTESLRVDTTAPSAPTVALPEALGGINAAEALSNSGTPLVVTLPVDAAVGDTVTTLVTNPDGTVLVLTHVIVASELPAAQGGTATGTGPFTVTQTIPSSALTVDGPWTTRTTVTDTAGNASVPQTASFTLDTAAPGTPGVALPEALNGVNAAEALSNGGTPINVTLPGDALVGDTVTTVVTLPTGGTLTLSHVLTAADIAAGSIGQLIPTSALTQDGTWSTSTTVTDLAGNTSAPRTGSFVLDTTPPAAPAAALATASDTGTLGDSTTADNTPSISGTGTPGDTITVTFPGGEVKTVVVAADGSWSVTPTTPLTDGVNTVTITATDPAGNVSAPTALPLTIDTTAPVAPTAALAAVSDTGTLGDSLTNDNTPTLSGTGVPGDTITVKDAAGNVIATAVVAPNGTWAATPTTALPDGLSTLSVTATDPAGNTGPAVALPITIDTGGPAAPAAALAVASDSGTLGDALTSDNTPSINGTGTPGDTITVTFPGGEVKTVAVAPNGSWSLTPTNPLVDGLNNITVTATDPAGNTSPATTVPVTIDTTPPAAPGADVAAASDTGASNTDNITSDTTPTISGAGATPGDTIKLYAPNGTTVLGTAVVAADGSWAITPTTPLAEGLSTLSVTATDPAGNTSAATPVPVTIDTTAPAAPTVNLQATNDSTPVITGTATLGAGETLTVTVTVNGATYNVTVGVGGVWSLNTSAVAPVSGTLGAFVDGQTYPVTATVTDAAGNATSDATTSELVFDTTAPSVPTVNTMATNDGTPVITGTANLLAGETLTVTVNGATYNVTVATNGTWRLDTGATTPASGTLGAFANGTSYPVVATITDLANNATSDTSTNELRFDTSPPATPAGDVAAASDTGSSNTDNITSDTTPTIVGTGTAGDIITLYAPNGTTVLGTAVVDAAGNWSITSTALPQGTSALQVTATDPAGNTSAPGTVSVTIDTTAPAAPAAVLDASSDTGLLGDKLTNDNTPTLSGTGEPDATITVKDANGNTIATATVAPDGTWSATPTTALPNGLNALSVTATDPAGNVSQPTALPITIDTTAPAAPAAALASSSDTGILGDAKTADTTPTLSGTGTPGDTITVTMPATTAFPNGEILTVVVAPDGSWSATPTEALADGPNNILVTATDPAGNTSPATTVPVTIDATAPAAPTPDVAATSDTGSSSTDNLTSDTTPTVQGTGTAGDTITLYAPNGTTVLGTATVAANGTWAITPTTALPDGTTALSVKATDPQGNTSAPGTVSVTIDTTAPAAPTAMLDSGSDTGNLGDSKTNDTTPTLSGMGVPGDTITVKNAAGTVIATATVAGDGSWSATPTTALPEGLNTLSVTATDPAGNTSLPTALPVTIDTTVAAPVIAPTNGVGAITGTGEPGATVTVSAGGNVLGTAVVDASGNWSLTPASAVPDTTVLSAAQTDLAGNTSGPDTETVDTSVPAINPTNGVLLTGTGKPGDTIALTLADGTVLRDANGAPLTAVVDSNGTWTATPGAPVPNGSTIVATASYDADSNPATAPVVRSVTDSTVVDATPPSAPVASLALASDTGTVGDSVTHITTPTLSGGGASPGDTIQLYAPDGTTLLGTAVVAPDGTWSITVPTALADGTHNFKLTATDPVGNTSAPATLPVTIDTSAPVAPAAALATTSDSGTVGDSITSDNTPTLTGTGTPGDTITITDAAGNVIATAVVGANGSWTATPTTALPDGVTTLAITATDPAGNTGPAASLPLTIDTTAPAAPAAVLASVSDSGTLGDSTTNDTTPTLSGTGTVGDTITVKDAAGNVIATAVVGAGGTWTATPTTPLPEGTSTLAITATDKAGNTGPATSLPITIDTTGPAAPAAALASVSDSGKLGDSTTTDTTPTLTGTGMPGDTITVKNAAGTVIATATVGTDGTWTATPTTALPEGVNALSVTATDPAGNTGAATALPITIDTTAPAAPAAALALVSDTGTVGDGTTTDNTPTVSGTGTPGDTITIKDAAGNVLATAVVAANGSWSATTPTLPDGVNALSVTATDPAGNTSAPTALPITVDTSVGAVSIAPTNGVGAITGTGEPGATLTLKDSATGLPVGTVTVGPDGSWSVPLTAALPDGTVLSATQTDAAGNTSSPDTETINTAIPVLAPSNGTALTGTGKPGDTIAITVNGAAVLDGLGNPLTAVVDADGNWTAVPGSPIPDGSTVTATDTASGLTDTTVVDATPPALPVGDVASASDTGTSNTDNLTSDNTPTITGSGATPGDTITLFAANGSTIIGTAVVAADGSWAITPTTALADGVQALKLNATDPLGNTSAQSTVTVTIDTTAPAAPVAALTSGSDSGTLGDNTTNVTTPTLSGTGEPGATISIKDAAGNVIATALVAANGSWSATTTTLPEGTNALRITATDAAGNTSPATPLTLVIDTVAPAQPAAPDLTAATDTGASSTDNLTNVSTPALAVTAPPAGGSVVLYVDGTAVAATYNASTGTVTPTVALTDGAHAITYKVVDAAGNASTASTALSVTIDTVAPAQPAAPDLTAATDSGSSPTDNTTNVSTPALAVTAPPAGGSVVLLVDGVPVDATYNATTGTLTPVVPLTDGAHAITYKVVDAAGNASAASAPLSVTIDTTAPAAPGGTLAAISDSGTLGDSITSDATPTITGTGTAGDTITLKDAAGNVIATATVAGDGSWSATPTASLANGTQTLHITATDPAGNVSPASDLPLTIVNSPTVFSGTTALAITESNLAQTVSGTLGFTDTDGPTTITALTNAAGTGGYGTFTTNASTGAWSYTMTSAQNQLTAGQVLTDTITVSAADGSSQVLSVTITGTNDQPYTVNSDYVTTLEDAAAPVNGVTQGTLISSLYLADAYKDADGTIAGVAFVGPRAIVSANPGLRAAWYSSDGGATWLSLDTAIATASTSNAFILGANARLYFQGPANDWGTFLSAPVRLWDGTDSANVGSYKDISSLTGANGAYSAADTTLSFVVIGVNDAPVNTVPAGPVITSPNTAQVITGLQVADLDVSSTVMTVKLAVASGTLTLLSGSGVTLAGNGTATVTLSGTQSNLNTLLATTNAVTYTPITGFLGSDTLTMTTTDNFVGDQWNTGPALSDVDTVAISVLQEQVTVAITDITTDSGTSNTDHITNDKTPTISGTSDKPNRPLTLTIAGVTFSVMTDGSGNWSVDTGALTPTSGTYDKTVGFADGVKAISVSLAGNMGGVATATSSVTIDTAVPTVLVTSVFGDAVGASGNGTFSGTERGFNLSDYTLSSTVTPLPVISGTTTAEDGQTVTVTLAGQTYTATASGGTWSVQVPSADAVLLNHGNTYAISASVSDIAGNAAVADTNNGLLVNIAPPDVPTVVSQTTLSTTPVITGVAKKLSGATSISLATGDVLTVVIKDSTGTPLTTGSSYTLTVGGTSSPAGLSYNTTTGAWSLAVPAGVLPATLATYNIDVSATAGGITRSDISSSELQIVVAPTITSIPEGPVINMVEAASVGGTPVNVGITGTGAVAGQVITVNWGTQTFTQVLTATDITNGTVAIVVPTATLQAQTAANTSGSVPVSVSLGNGVTSAVTTETVNFVTPAAPTINSVAWAATGAGNTSSLTGIPEAYYDKHAATFAGVTSTIIDNKLYYSEAIATADSGTIVRVQLPVGTGSVNPPVVGDTLILTWGDQTLATYTLTTADVTTNKFVDVTVPFQTIDSQAFGNVAVTAKITSTASGNSSVAAQVSLVWAYDQQTADLASTSSGFNINGRAASDKTGMSNQDAGVVNVGDVNGDGYDDFALRDALTSTSNSLYVVYGRTGVNNLELSTLQTAGNSNGFIVSGLNGSLVSTAGDINGDGLYDLVLNSQSTTAYVFLGKTSSPGSVAFSNFAPSNGYTITAPSAIQSTNLIGDVNGDGYDDVLIKLGVGTGFPTGTTYVLYGSSGNSNVTLPTMTSGTFSNGFIIDSAGSSIQIGSQVPPVYGDFNGDGYGDFAVAWRDNLSTNPATYGGVNVYFGGSNLTGMTTKDMSVAGFGRGFAINGLTEHYMFSASTAGDINGDGFDDLVINDSNDTYSQGNRSYVMFGKTGDAPVNVSALVAGNGGFVMYGAGHDADVIGDFNGDGLADLVVTQDTLSVNGVGSGGAYLIYGRTGTTALTLSNLAVSEGFRIEGLCSGDTTGQSVTAGGDINGDGFADLVITSPMGDPINPARTDAGITRVVFGGPSRLNSMTFQTANGDAIGTTGADSLAGTSGANQLVGGDGNDTLTGAGGADVLYGGRGDDTLVIDASNIAALATNSGNTTQAIARVDGGTGTDTLQLMGSLDLGTIRPAAIQSIERINMFSAGTSLTMGLLDVLGLSEKNNPFNTATGWTATTATNWDAVNNGAQVVVDGTAANDLYLSGAWQSIGLVEHTETVNGSPVTKTYKVLSDLTKAEAQVLVDSNVKVHMAPTVITTANELAGSLNLTEANSLDGGNTVAGTDVRINLVDTDAAVGMVIKLNWGGQMVSVTLTATDITNGYATLPLTADQLKAETPVGTTENVAASVTLLSGTTTVAQSVAQPVAVNFVVPTTPIIDSTAWAANNIDSTLTGIPEAAYAMDTAVIPAPAATVYVDNTLYYSEVVNTTNTGSTIMRVQLPTTGLVPTVAGDMLTVRWGDQVINVGAVSATDITNKYIDVTISQATLETQAFGNVVVSADITSAASGNTSLTSPLTVKWAYDLPLAQLHSLSQGFQIEGNISAGKLGVSNENQGAQNVGDVNGDGFDDLEMTDINGNRYIVYGGNLLGAVNVADFTAPGNTNGFMIASTGKLQPTRGGDINGDGLSDILIGNGSNSYIIFGKTTSIGKVTLATLGTNGFAFTGSNINEPSVVGDVNGDGYEDMLFNNSSNFTNYLVFGGTNFTPGGSVALPTGTSGTLATGTGAGTSYVQITNGGSFNSGGVISTLHGDFNGDGYSDFALAQTPTTGIGTGPVYVYYGSASVTPWNSSALTLAGNGRGFQITGLTGQNSIKFETTNMGDVNGDGMDDIAFNDGTTRAFVLFGKTNSTSVNTTDLSAGNGGFIINAGTNNNNSVLTDVDVVGDFNGDGLADMVVSNTGMYTSGVVGGGAYLIYGRTATTALTLDSLEVSQGFRISGYSSTKDMLLGRTATAAGDFNGDGFADLAITTYQGEATGMTSTYLNQAGITRIVYGGVDKLETMTFQTANGDAIGTTGADTLLGTSGNNQIVAGDGADTLTGAGGADVLYGGRGDDLIIVNADNVAKLGMNTGNNSEAIARVDGGAGIDTLRLDGGGIMLDLSLVSSPALQNIEQIDLTGSGNNTLKLSLQDMLQSFDNSNVFNSSNTTSGLAAKVTKNQLMVDGDTGDKLVLSDLANWSTAGNVVANGHTYVAYNHNTSAQQLLIDLNVQVSAS